MQYRIREENELKPSGVEWLGDIPKDWEQIPLGRLGNFTSSGIDKLINENESVVKIINFTDVYSNKTHVLNSTLNYMKVTTPEANRIKNLVKKGDLIFLPSSETYEDLGLAALVDEELENTAFSYHVIRLQFTKNIEHNFRKYLTNNTYVLNIFSSFGNGTTRKTLNRDVFKKTKVLMPSFIEQQKIANFLDKKSEIFDDAISKKEQLISKLELAKQSLISEVVTGKLKVVETDSKLQTLKREPNELKPSGVEWLGDIPKEWILSRFDYETRIKARLGWKGLKAEEYVDEGYAFLATPNIKYKNIDFENVNYITKERYEESPEIMLELGDVLLTKDGSTTGTVNVVRNLPKKTTVNSSIAVIRPKKTIDSLFLFYYISSTYMQDTINLMLGGMGVPHLFQGDLNKFKLLLPNINEQKQISKYLDEKLIHFDKAIEKTKQSIAKLKLAKEDLIGQAVTGKIEIL